MEAILASLAGTAASNAMSEWHADKQMSREKQLMNKQNAMNRANALDAYSQQVQGARLAGLSPAMLNGQPPTIAPAVSKGSVSQAENVEIDPSTLLLDAQRKNVEADTDKKKAETAKIEGADTENTKADTNLKTAQTLSEGEKPANIKMDTRKKGFEINKTWAESENLYAQKPNIEAQTGKIKAETSKTRVDATRISQLNEQYKDQNKALQKIGPQIAQEIMASPTWNDFDESTKVYFREVANGKLNLTVGGLDAVNNLVQSNDKIKSTDKDALAYSLNKKVLSIQDDPNTIDALAQMPQIERDKASKLLEKFESEIANINADKTLKDDDHKIKEIEKHAKKLELDIQRISPEGQATTGDGWEYIKSLARSYVEEPTKLIAPFAAIKAGSNIINNKSNNEHNFKKTQPLQGKPTNGVENMKFKRK